jgi:hypothetical protein
VSVPVHKPAGPDAPASVPESPTRDAPMVYLAVTRDGWTGKLQLSIGDDTSGYRIAGPKFNGSSTDVLRHTLSEGNVINIAGRLRHVVMDPSVTVLPQIYGHPVVDWVRQTRAAPALIDALSQILSAAREHHSEATRLSDGQAWGFIEELAQTALAKANGETP